jgi:hypothetical protein
MKNMSYWKAYISGIIIHANSKLHITEKHVYSTFFVKNWKSMNQPYVPECTNSLAVPHSNCLYYENYNGKTLENNVLE